MKFDIYDNETGRPVDTETIDEIAKTGNLIRSDIDGFALTEDGRILLLDDCGNSTECDNERFFVRRTDYFHPDLEQFEKIMYGNIANTHPELLGNVVGKKVTIHMFPQTWASTAGGFEAPGMVAGAAMTTDETTVMIVTVYYRNGQKIDEKPFYGVFFGNDPAYMVEDPKKEFFDDLSRRDMKSKYIAEKTQAY